MSAPAGSRPSIISARSEPCGGETDRRTKPVVSSRHTCWSPARTSRAGPASTSASSRDIVRPYTAHSRPSSAAVGLTSARSTRDSVDRLTSASRANSSKVHPRSSLSSAMRCASRSSAAVSIPIFAMLSRM